MITVKHNDYKEPFNGIREEVVQVICDCFLERKHNFVYHPFSEIGSKGYREATDHIVKDKFGYWSIRSQYSSVVENRTENTYIKFNKAEMQRAFNKLINAGYHIYKVYEYGSWMGYSCIKEPYPVKWWHNAIEVYEFNDDII
jgi:hypothetical protein